MTRAVAPRRRAPRTRAAAPPRGAAGHTLLELVVALAVGGVLLTLATTTSRELTVAGGRLETRAHELATCDVLLEWLRRDLGAAAQVTPRERTALHLVREPARAAALGIVPAAADAGVVYRLVDGLLLREDLALELRQVVARDVTRFEVRDLVGLEVEILFSVGRREEDLRERRLVWQVRS